MSASKEGYFNAQIHSWKLGVLKLIKFPSIKSTLNKIFDWETVFQISIKPVKKLFLFWETTDTS